MLSKVQVPGTVRTGMISLISDDHRLSSDVDGRWLMNFDGWLRSIITGRIDIAGRIFHGHYSYIHRNECGHAGAEWVRTSYVLATDVQSVDPDD